MKKNEIIDRSRKFAEPYCVTNGKNFIDALASLKLQYPEVSAEQHRQLELVKEELIANDEPSKSD